MAVNIKRLTVGHPQNQSLTPQPPLVCPPNWRAFQPTPILFPFSRLLQTLVDPDPPGMRCGCPGCPQSSNLNTPSEPHQAELGQTEILPVGGSGSFRNPNPWACAAPMGPAVASVDRDH